MSYYIDPVLAIKNRIHLLESRPKENYKIIKKLKRKLRNLEAKTD